MESAPARWVLALLVLTLAPYMGQATIPGAYGTLREPPLMQVGGRVWAVGMRAMFSKRSSAGWSHTPTVTPVHLSWWHETGWVRRTNPDRGVAPA
jgi:hypothetical protein